MRFPVMAAAAVATLVAMAPAKAAEVAITLSIPVTGSTTVNSNVMAYSCTDDRAVTATYINAGEVSLAVLDLAGTTVVTSNVIAASGARYAGGRYVWWSRGEEADLFDLMGEGGDNEPVAHCTIIK